MGNKWVHKLLFLSIGKFNNIQSILLHYLYGYVVGRQDSLHGPKSESFAIIFQCVQDLICRDEDAFWYIKQQIPCDNDALSTIC